MNKRELTKPKQCLIEKCQDIFYGRVTFYVVQGEPDSRRSWWTRRTVKLSGGENGPWPEAGSADFELRKEHVALFEQLTRLRDGTCVTIEVKYGLPFLIEIEQEHQAA